LTKEADGIPRLEQFPEIVNTSGNDQQAAEAVGHGVKDNGLLNEEEICQRQQQIYEQEVKKDFFGFSAPDDLPHQIDLKREDHHTLQVNEEEIVDLMHCRNISSSIYQAVDKQEE
jgi:hypothetical protein